MVLEDLKLLEVMLHPLSCPSDLVHLSESLRTPWKAFALQDMGQEKHCLKDDRDFRQLSSVAKHYSLPLLSYEAVVEAYRDQGGNTSLLWPSKVQRFSDWAGRHPEWPGQVFYAEMVAQWLNTKPGASVSRPT